MEEMIKPPTQDPEYIAQIPEEIRVDNHPKETKEEFPAAAEIVQNSEKTWSIVGEQLYKIKFENFRDNFFSKKVFKEDFENAENIFAVVRNNENNLILGFTYAVPTSYDEKEAYIRCTAISPEYQNKGLISKLMSTLEPELRRRGYDFFSRDAAVDNGYADKIKKYYADRIVKTGPNGRQQYFQIKL